MADTTTNNSASNINKPNTPPSTSATEGASKPTSDSLLQTSSGLPPITKEAMSTAGAPLVPTNPLSQANVPTPPPEPVNEPVAPSADLSAEAAAPQNELKEKTDAADTLTQQAEKPADNLAADVASSSLEDKPAASATDAAFSKAPKPVAMEDVQDEASGVSASNKEVPTPIAAAEKPADTSATEEPVQQTPAATAIPDAAEAPKTDAEAGDKRKADESEVVSEATENSDEKSQEEPAEKKLKTNEGEAPVAPKKVGRPKKDKTAEKKAPAPVGKTARRTRSQGVLAAESL